ncbi:MAG: ABC transporter permease [Truepera sp.]|nr:ABC transporter permease [Truepera sp.]
MLTENIRSAIEALFANRLRSALTLLGVVIGVFAVTTTVSMGQIATAGITAQIQDFGAQSLFVVVNNDNPRATRFTGDDIEALSRLPVDILRSRSTGGLGRAGNEEARITLNGQTANAVNVDRSLRLARGRYFSEAEYLRAAPVIVLSADAAETFFPDLDNPVGQEIVVQVGQSRTFYTVIGVRERIGGALGAFANDVSGDIPLETLYSNFPNIRRNEYNVIPITVRFDVNISDIEQQVRAILDRRRGSDTYNLQTIEGALGLFNTITLILQAVLGGIGSISLLVGGIGILNIMLVSVTERTREIGLRKALGAKKGTILQQFLIEAVTLTVIGGVIGLALSIGSLYLIVALVPFIDTVIINPLTILLALFVSIATGVLFGVWPANRAANLSPIEALRYE